MSSHPLYVVPLVHYRAPASAGASYKYECQSDCGSLLALQDDVHVKYVLENQTWINYMALHHESWYQFVTETKGHRIQKEDLILVRGCIKAERWAAACFRSRGQALKFSLSGYVPYGSIEVTMDHYSEDTCSDAARWAAGFVRDGPPTQTIPTLETTPSTYIETEEPKDCVFLSAYIAKYRRVLPGLTIRAAAGDTKYDRRDHPGEALEVTTNPERYKVRLSYDMKIYVYISDTEPSSNYQ